MGYRVTIDDRDIDELGCNLSAEAAGAVWVVAQRLGAEVSWCAAGMQLIVQSPAPTFGRVMREKLARSLSGAVPELRSPVPPPREMLSGIDSAPSPVSAEGGEVNAMSERNRSEDKGAEPERDEVEAEREASAHRRRSERESSDGHKSTAYHRPYRYERGEDQRPRKKRGCCSAGGGRCDGSVLPRYEPE